MFIVQIFFNDEDLNESNIKGNKEKWINIKENVIEINPESLVDLETKEEKGTPIRM